MKEKIKELMIKLAAFAFVLLLVIVIVSALRIYQNREEIYEKVILSNNDDVKKVTIEILNNTGKACVIFIDDNNKLDNFFLEDDVLQTQANQVYKRPMLIKATDENIHLKMVAIKDIENNLNSSNNSNISNISNNIYEQEFVIDFDKLSKNVVFRLVWDGNRFIE